MEEEDKKAERDLEILKKYHKKETKSVKKIFYISLNLAKNNLATLVGPPGFEPGTNTL